MSELLALFPLQTVLFPGATLPLHIFEPRYRTMVNRCMQLSKPFGVVLIREGVEVGGSAIPHEIGTTAAIQNALRFKDGQMLLAAVGQRRFEIEQIVETEPYLVATVNYLEDTASPESASMALEIRELYQRHYDALVHATGVSQEIDDLPEDPVALSYHLSTQFQVVDYSKQQLLEATLDERLAAIADALHRELELLPTPPATPPATTTGPWSIN